MSRTTNESTRPLKEYERLTIAPKSPTFLNQAQQVSKKDLVMAVNQCIQPMREDDGLATDCRYPIFLNLKLKISKQETASQVVDEANLTNFKLNRSFTEQVDAHQKQRHVEDSIDYSPMSPKPMRRYQRRNSKTAAMLSPSVASIQQQSALPSTLFLLSNEHVSPFNSDLPMDKGSNEAVPSTSRKKRTRILANLPVDLKKSK
jgi:hypothetical protein